MSVVRAIYRIRTDGSVEERAAALALEQTVELPREALVGEAARHGLVGRVEGIDRDPEGGHRVGIAYPVAAAADDPAQLLNLLWGNASLQGGRDRPHRPSRYDLEELRSRPEVAEFIRV